MTAFESLAIQVVLPTFAIFLKLFLYLTFVLNFQLHERWQYGNIK